MSKIPTARSIASGKAEAQRIIEFAKLHVKAALEAASKRAKVYDYKTDKSLKQHMSSDGAFIVDKKSIRNAYPEENIK